MRLDTAVVPHQILLVFRCPANMTEEMTFLLIFDATEILIHSASMRSVSPLPISACGLDSLYYVHNTIGHCCRSRILEVLCERVNEGCKIRGKVAVVLPALISVLYNDN
jgi:hypothetical protein